MTDRATVSYTEIAEVLAGLPQLLRDARGTRGISIGAAAGEIGCGYTTLHRTEGGGLPDVRTALLMLRWLGGA